MKDRLKHEINWRIQFVVNDCSTFIRVRRELPDWYKQAGVGGGNFMMAQSLFSALNFLAKVYTRLRHRDKHFFSDEHRNAVKNAVQNLRAEGRQSNLREIFPEIDFRALLNRDALTQWKPPRPGDCADETNAFKMLIEAMSSSVSLGFSPPEAGEVWRQFRNALAHMAAPKSVVESEGPTKDLPSFRKSDSGNWICNVDRLTVDLQAVASWVCKEIEHETNQDRISDTLNWIVDAPGMSKADFSTTTTTTSTVTTQNSPHGYTGSYSVTHIPPPLDPRPGGTRQEPAPPKRDPNS